MSDTHDTTIFSYIRNGFYLKAREWMAVSAHAYKNIREWLCHCVPVSHQERGFYE